VERCAVLGLDHSLAPWPLGPDGRGAHAGPEFESLFSSADRERARERLKAYGWQAGAALSDLEQLAMTLRRCSSTIEPRSDRIYIAGHPNER
jgi:hypothetical protein